MKELWLLISGINEHYGNKLFFKEFCLIALTYIVIGGILIFSYFGNLLN